jgi:hypothetical protein
MGIGVISSVSVSGVVKTLQIWRFKNACDSEGKGGAAGTDFGTGRHLLESV